MTRIGSLGLPLALLLAAAALAAGCQPAPRPAPAARQSTADLLGLHPPTTLPGAAGASGVAGEDATAFPSGHHLLTLPGVFDGGKGIVYVIDEDRDVLSAMTYVGQTQRLDHMDPIDLGQIFGLVSSAASRYDVVGGAHTARGQKYTAVLCPLAPGDDALYLLNRAGLVVVFSYNPTSRHLEPLAGASMADVLKK